MGPLAAGEREADRLRVQYTAAPKHHIENDQLALHFRCERSPRKGKAPWAECWGCWCCIIVWGSARCDAGARPPLRHVAGTSGGVCEHTPSRIHRGLAWRVWML